MKKCFIVSNLVLYNYERCGFLDGYEMQFKINDQVRQDKILNACSVLILNIFFDFLKLIFVNFSEYHAISNIYTF